jgi:hypothetical protein
MEQSNEQKMENKSARKRLFAFTIPLALPLCLLVPTDASAHDIPVHENITWNAEASATERSQNYNEFLNTIFPNGASRRLTWGGAPKRASSWLEDGSAQEDNFFTDDGGGRSLNHFYDPFSELGLSDIPFGAGPRLIGVDSFRWASTLDGPAIDIRVGPIQNVGKRNSWSWQNARQFEWRGLTESSPAAREETLAKMFRAVGQVVHLLQDASQPQHARNEQHLDKFIFKPFYKSPIEYYGAAHHGSRWYSHGMLDWRAAGFTQLRDFWDRDFYTWDRNTPRIRNAQPLITRTRWCRISCAGLFTV